MRPVSFILPTSAFILPEMPASRFSFYNHLMNGILVIDKPAGFTSHDVVAKLRGVLGEKRVGHTGTLDPFATGVLVLLVGRATRLAQFLAAAEKEYEATVRLGRATDTGDLTGKLLESSVQHLPALDAARVQTALQSLRGELWQVPPMHSAKKVQGRKLYELARRGEEIERQPARVNISCLEAVSDADGVLLRHSPDGKTCDLKIRVACSAGTYVRVLAEDIGRNLGTPAHLVALRRTRAGAFRLEQAQTIEQLQSEAKDDLAKYIIPSSAALSEMPALHLTDEEARKTRHGMALSGVQRQDLTDGGHVRLEHGAGELIAIGVYDQVNQMVRPRVMLAVN